MSANKIALLPILSSQKNTYNFKELSTQVSSFVDAAAKAIMSLDREKWTPEELSVVIQQQVALAYGDKNKKDKNSRPEQAKSAYIFFCTAKRQKVREDYPDMDSKEITVKLAQMWKETTEEEKQPFVEAHLRDKSKLAAARESDSDSDIAEKPKRVRAKAKKSESSDKLEVVGHTTTSGFSKTECVKVISKKTVRDLQDFVVWVYGEDAIPENLKVMKKPILLGLVIQLMEQNNYANFSKN